MLNRRDQFPVLFPDTERDKQVYRSLECPLYVPWPFVAEHEKQCYSNHSQSPQRLSERGGLTAAEMVAIVEDRPWHDMTLSIAVTSLKTHLADWRKRTSYGQKCAVAGCNDFALIGPRAWLPSRCETHLHALLDAGTRPLLLPEEHARRLLECIRYIRTREETNAALEDAAVMLRALDREMHLQRAREREAWETVKDLAEALAAVGSPLAVGAVVSVAVGAVASARERAAAALAALDEEDKAS